MVLSHDGYFAIKAHFSPPEKKTTSPLFWNSIIIARVVKREGDREKKVIAIRVCRIIAGIEEKGSRSSSIHHSQFIYGFRYVFNLYMLSILEML